MSLEPRQPTNGSAGLSPEAYLAELRISLRHEVRGEAIEELRERIDVWVIDGVVDPFEPLTNQGRRAISWNEADWVDICSNLSVLLWWIIDNAPSRCVPFEKLPPDLACYFGLIVLELNTQHDPLFDHLDEAVVLPLVVAAMKKIEPRLFRRYLIGVFDRREVLDENALNYGKLVWMTALGSALGAADDPVIGHRVREVRLWLDQHGASGEAHFRDMVPARCRPLWTSAVQESPADAQAWAQTFMK